MTDKKDQASSEKPSPRYRALRDGAGYKANTVFDEVRIKEWELKD